MGRDRMGDKPSKTEREKNDFYITNPKDVRDIMNILKLPKNIKILDPCAGLGHISETLRSLGYKVITNDIIQREYLLDYNKDFLLDYIPDDGFNYVIMNPPFKYAKEFIEKALTYAEKVLVIAKIELLESEKRRVLNTKFLSKVYVHCKRAKFGLNGDESYFNKSSSMATAWYIYDKNKSANTIIEFI